MINIINKTDCCGCNACGDVCSKHAITFKTDIEGFWYPEVNNQICNNCGLCEKVCPIMNICLLKQNNLPQSICYAAEHKNIEVVFDSTSGGLFSALADIMYRDNGYVGGAIFNSDFSVRQYISNNRKDLPKLRSSKYLQSNLEGFYKNVRELVKSGEKVLVCGSPCQMAALRAFLMYKDYPNLIIADYICRGINSPKVWKKYIDSFEERYGSKVVYCKAKSKEYGWRNLTQKVILEDGRHLYETDIQSNFTKGYLRTGVYCRPSCYECKFKGYPRISDITLADFWGIEKVDRSMEKDLGTSLVMINSKKGEAFFEKVKPKTNYIQVPFTSIEKGNRSLNLPVDPPKVNRDEFFKDLDKMSFVELSAKYINTPNIPKSPYTKLKQIVKKGIKSAKFIKSILEHTGLNPKSIYRLFHYNTLCNIRKGNILLISPYVRMDVDEGAQIIVNGIVRLGTRRCKSSKLESRLIIERGAKLEFNGSVNIFYGFDIELFNGSNLVFNGSNGSNIGLTIICSEKIFIGENTEIGRNVTIRDNNGGHYINRQGYKNTNPIYIGNKVWLCESCTIMPGVKIGDGSIIGAGSFVVRKVPAHSLVAGHPAEVVDEDILWKY